MHLFWYNQNPNIVYPLAAVESLGFDQSNNMIKYLLQEMRDQEMDFPAFVKLMTAHAVSYNFFPTNF